MQIKSYSIVNEYYDCVYKNVLAKLDLGKFFFSNFETPTRFQ